MRIKLNGICNKCHTMFPITLDFEDEKDLHTKLADEKCRVCDGGNIVLVMKHMTAITKALLKKGYTIVSVFPKEVGVEITPTIPDELLEQLPKNYVYKYTKKSVIIYNEELFNNNEEISAHETSTIIIHLLNWIRKLSSVGIGHILTQSDIEEWEGEDNND